MSYVAPDKEELARRGRNPDGTLMGKPAAKPKVKKAVKAGPTVSKPTLRENKPKSKG